MVPQMGDWRELDLTAEFWSGDPSALARPAATVDLLRDLPRRARRDAIRTWRGSVLRTEVYAHDGTARADRPYTVTESAFAVREEPTGTLNGQRVFYPHPVARRTTTWERGEDPMTRLTFSADFDIYGQTRKTVEVGVPRGRDYRVTGPAVPYLATRTLTRFAQRDDAAAGIYIVDRVCRIESEELTNNGTGPAVDLITALGVRYALTVHRYDGLPFEGLPPGQLGDHGALMRTETLAFTREQLTGLYTPPGDAATIPPYLEPGAVAWTAEYPPAVRSALPALAGYVLRAADADFATHAACRPRAATLSAASRSSSTTRSPCCRCGRPMRPGCSHPPSTITAPSRPGS